MNDNRESVWTGESRNKTVIWKNISSVQLLNLDLHILEFFFRIFSVSYHPLPSLPLAAVELAGLWKADSILLYGHYPHWHCIEGMCKLSGWDIRLFRRASSAHGIRTPPPALRYSYRRRRSSAPAYSADLLCASSAPHRKGRIQRGSHQSRTPCLAGGGRCFGCEKGWKWKSVPSSQGWR